MLTTGILIVAVKHAYYGRLAYNLALTIRAVDSTFNIAVLCDSAAMAHLSESQKEVFTQLIDIGPDIPKGCGTKLWAYDYSPFDETLVLDADMVWLPRRMPDEVFNEMQGVEFTSITEGFYDSEANHDTNPKYFYWAQPQEIQNVYNVERVYQWRTEVMYFKKGVQAHAMFDYAKVVFAKPRLKTLLAYATGVADELAINVSCAVHGMTPHRYKWKASYWNRLHGYRLPEYATLYADYYLASFGSNENQGEQKKFYNTIVKAACYKLGKQHIFQLQSKREVLPERLKM
jgi:hypothetical protein